MKRDIFFTTILVLLILTSCAQAPETDENAEIQKRTTEETARIVEERTKEITKGSSVEQEDCDRTPNKRQFTNEPYYTGPLIDTHLHLPVSSSIVSNTAMQMGFEDMPHIGQIPTSKIVCLMEKEGVTKAFGFLIQHRSILSSSVNVVKQDTAKYPGKFAPFFMPPFPIESQVPEAAAVEETLKSNPGLFQGYGEARFDFEAIPNAHPEDDYFQQMYQLADKYNLIVQIHPDNGQVDVIERVLQKYPNVIFLVHLMKDDRAEVPRLLEKYPNMYYSLDAEISYIFGYQTIQNNKGPTKEEYVSALKSKFDSQLKEVLASWKPVIEAHPDQFTWGTDRWFTWHFDPEVSALVVEFGRSFTGQLDPAVQEKFAYKNAERMLANS